MQLPVFPFVVGSARSGTTLMRVMLDCHPQLAVPRESQFITTVIRERAKYEREGGFDHEAFAGFLVNHHRFKRWNVPEDVLRAALADPPPAGLADALRRVYATYATLQEKPRYGDKTPRYSAHIPKIAALLPESRFIHVIRDGRETALSIVEWPFPPYRLDEAVLYWRKHVEAARRDGPALGSDRYFEYRHEDLLDDPPTTLKKICEFIDLPFDEGMLQYYEKRTYNPEFFRQFPHGRHLVRPPTKGLRDWRKQMSPEDVELAERLAGDLLVELGYERATDVPSMSYEDAKAFVEWRVRRDEAKLSNRVRKSAERARRAARTAARRAPGAATVVRKLRSVRPPRS